MQELARVLLATLICMVLMPALFVALAALTIYAIMIIGAHLFFRRR